MLCSPAENPTDSALEILIAKYLELEESGQPQSQQEWLTRFPDLSDELQVFFESRRKVPRLWPTRPLAETPSQLGDYELLEPIARGGMGIVYKARHTRLNRIVALKLIVAGQLARRSDVERFHAEAQAAASLEHPNIVPIYEVGQHAGQHYFTMKLIPGGSLADARAQAPGSSQGMVRMLSTVTRAVHFAHQRGILHRDLKPSNILLDAEGRPYVTDFGLAKRVGTDDSMSGSGGIVGTPLYMAPEQAAGSKDLTTAADIYSLGAILYWLLTGKPALQGMTPLETLRRVQDQEPLSPRSLDPTIDRDLETICLKCLEKDAQRRYDSAAALADDLDRWLADEAIFARPLTTVEKIVRWAKRQPTIASLSLAVVSIAALGLFGVLHQWQAAIASEQKAIASATTAQAREQEANEQRDRIRAVNDQLQQTLYTADINLAQHTWRAGAAERVLELLDRHRPSTGQEDLRGFEWYYLHRLCHSDLLTIKVPAATISCITYSPDGELLAAAMSDGAVVLWNANSGRMVRTHACRLPARWVAFSRDGKRLAGACSGQGADFKQETGGEVTVWDVESGEQLLRIAENGRATCATFSPDVQRLASTSDDGVKMWDAHSGQLLWSAAGPHSGILWSAAFTPDGQRLVTSGGKHVNGLPGELRVWDAATGRSMQELKGHSGFVFGVAVSPDGQRVASTSWDRTARVWELATGEESFVLKDHAGPVNSIAFSPDGQRLATGSHDGTVRLYDARNGREQFLLRGRTGYVFSLAFSPDGKRLASARSSDAPPRKIETERNRAASANTAPSGAFIDAYINVWDAERSQEHLALAIPASRELRLEFSPRGDRLFAVGGTALRVWETEHWREVLRLNPFAGDSQSYLFAGCVSPDGGLLATAGSLGLGTAGVLAGGLVTLRDAESGKEVRALVGHDDLVSDVAFSPDGQRLATASNDHTVKIWEAQTGREAMTFRGHRAPPWCAAFSHDGARVASGGPRTELQIWDAQTGDEVPFNGKRFGAAYCVAFSPDGKYLAGGSLDWTVRIWNAQSGAELQRLKGHVARVVRLAFSPDGKRLASSSADRTVKVWNVGTGEELLSLAGHADAVASVAFSPDGHRLASGATDGTIKIWDATPVSPKNAD